MIRTVELTPEEFWEYTEKSCSAFGILAALYHQLDVLVRKDDIEADDLYGHFMELGRNGIEKELGFVIPYEELDRLYTLVSDGVGGILITLARQHGKGDSDNVVNLATVGTKRVH